MARLTYTGQYPIHAVPSGNWKPGQTRTIPDEDHARALLTRPDFKKAPAAKKKKATATAAATTNQEACADHSS